MIVRQYNSAFTLIELAVVILILGFAMAVIFPRLNSGALERARLASNITKIASIATYARNRAASTRFTHMLHLDIEQGEYWVTAQTPAGQEVPITRGLTLRGRLADGVQFRDVQISGKSTPLRKVATLRFSPEGWADPAVVHIDGPGGETGTIIIAELSGRVETYDSHVEVDRKGQIYGAQE